MTEEERRSLRDACRSFLESEAPLAKVRKTFEDGPATDPGLWKEMAGLGWSGALVPEELGGSGLDLESAAVLLEEIGRQLTPCPLASSAVLATSAVRAAGSAKQQQEILPALAAGEVIGTVALCGSAGRYEGAGVEVSAVQAGERVRLGGVAAFVPDGHVADFFVVTAREADGSLSLYVVDAHAEGLRIEPLAMVDLTRVLVRLELRDVEVAADARLGEPGSGERLTDLLVSLGALCVSADSSGGAARMLEVSVEFAKNRVQFGRPIGSFQAIKHRLADLYVLVEASAAATRRAARELALDVGAASTASLAKAYTADAYATVAGDSIRVHGAVGLTWEYDQHLYLKRAKLNQQLFGDSAWHRDRLLSRVLAERARRGGET